MKKVLVPLSCLLWICSGVIAQKTVGIVNDPPQQYSHSVAFGLYAPFGEFSHSHFAGAGIDHSWSRNRFGTDTITYKKIGFIVNSGVHYFIGKKMTTAGSDFRYGNYFTLYAMPGIIYSPLQKASVSVTAGPALNIYKTALNAGYGSSLFINYYISKKITLGPGVVYKKRADTNALWSVAIRASYCF